MAWVKDPILVPDWTKDGTVAPVWTTSINSAVIFGTFDTFEDFTIDVNNYFHTCEFQFADKIRWSEE